MSDIQSISQGNYILHNIDAKKLYVQEPLFTANSGDAVYVGWRPDETVLYSGTGTSAVTLSEPYTNFESIKIYHGGFYCDEFHGLPAPTEFRFWHMYGNNSQATFKCAMIQVSGIDSTHIQIMNTKTLAYNFTATSTQANNVTNNDTYAKNIVTQVVGINRKENA